MKVTILVGIECTNSSLQEISSQLRCISYSPDVRSHPGELLASREGELCEWISPLGKILFDRVSLLSIVVYPIVHGTNEWMTIGLVFVGVQTPDTYGFITFPSGQHEFASDIAARIASIYEAPLDVDQ